MVMATPADISSAARGQAGASLQQDVSRLAAVSPVKAALAWFHAHQQEVTERQLALTRIPAPPFGESARAEWLKARFLEIGLEQVQVDEVGNVFGVRLGADAEKRGQYITMTAHLDTVFPPGTPMEVRHDGGRLYGPGISDNGAGVTALLAVAQALHAASLQIGRASCRERV